MTSKWQATFPLTPVAKGRGRACVVNGRARVFTPQKTRKAEDSLRYFISQSNPILFEGPICVSIDFTFVRPASVSAKKRPHPSTRPDLDNLIKTVSDAANGLLWKDDAQIVTLMTRKRYGDQPSISVAVWMKDRRTGILSGKVGG